jgi:rubrerythrin
MACQTSDLVPDLGRRRLMLIASAVGLGGLLELPFARLAFAAPEYVDSVEALRQGVAVETAAHHRYVQFGQLAKRDGYRGLAYLYTALATSELIHAQNCTRVLAMLGELVDQPEPKTIPLGTAKENLIYAAESELRSIGETYPGLFRAVADEGHTDAIAVIQYSWASHKQHLDIIEKIRRWTPDFFESVATKIDERTDHYFVCQVCGSTVTELPEDACPVCKEAPSKYRLIAHDRFF